MRGDWAALAADYMARRILTSFRGRLAQWLMCTLLLGACTSVPPVQEMSDARQAIRAAIDADAKRLAPDTLHKAEILMDEATQSLERGAYAQARHEAVSAKEQAIAARDRSLAKTKTVTTAP